MTASPVPRIVAPSEYTPVRLPKAAELVARQLRRQIVTGELSEGDALPQEGELTTQFGISRPTLREALRILESEGLISVSRGVRGGAIVHRPSARTASRYVGFVLQAEGTTLADVYRTRLLVGPPAARIVAVTQSAAAPAILRACIEQGRAHFYDDFDFGYASAAFDRKLIELTGIRTLVVLTGVLNDILERYLTLVTVTAGRAVDNTRAKQKSLRAKEKLIALIEAADGDGAEQFWRLHIEAVERALAKWQLSESLIDVMESR